MYNFQAMPSQIDPRLLDQIMLCEAATIGHFRNTGFVDPAIRSILPQTRVAGTAVTLSLAPGDGTLLSLALDRVRPGDVLMIDHATGGGLACWGNVMNFVAKREGVAAVIIDGFSTDIVELRAHGLPVFSRGSAAQTTTLAGIGGQMNNPVHIGGVLVRPGDAVLADENGVVVMPPEDIVSTATTALHMQQAELETLARIEAGERISDLSGAIAIMKRVNCVAD